MARIFNMTPRVVDPHVVLFVDALSQGVDLSPGAVNALRPPFTAGDRVMTIDRAGAHPGRVLTSQFNNALVRFDNGDCAWIDTPLLRRLPSR